MERFWLKIVVIVLLGLITPFMQQFVPVAGGGVSLIFVLSVPILFGISLIFALLVYIFERKQRHCISNYVFLVGACLLVFMALAAYPYG